MLKDNDAIATVATANLDKARQFYAEVLGLKLVHTEGKEALTFQSGRSSLIVYRSQYAGTNKATAVNFRVGEELGAIVGALEKKGVTFERYDFPDVRHEGALHVMGPMKVAWFKDPDGNIISLMNR